MGRVAATETGRLHRTGRKGVNRPVSRKVAPILAATCFLHVRRDRKCCGWDLFARPPLSPCRTGLRRTWPRLSVFTCLWCYQELGTTTDLARRALQPTGNEGATHFLTGSVVPRSSIRRVALVDWVHLGSPCGHSDSADRAWVVRRPRTGELLSLVNPSFGGSGVKQRTRH
jgi:hypothetical protein